MKCLDRWLIRVGFQFTPVDARSSPLGELGIGYVNHFFKHRIRQALPCILLALAVAVFVFGHWVLPMLSPSGSVIPTLLEGFGAISRLFSFVLLVLAAFTFLSSRLSAKKRQIWFEKHSSIRSVHSLTWEEYESYCAELFARRGYDVIENSKKGADGGVDLRLRKDRRVIIVQCKHYKVRKVGAPVVRDLLGTLTAEKADSGIVVSSGLFTKSAKQFADANNIELIDGPTLAASFAVGDQTDVNPSVVLCPKCGADMKRRQAKQGHNKGSYFFGCTHYPKCRGTIDTQSIL